MQQKEACIEFTIYSVSTLSGKEFEHLVADLNVTGSNPDNCTKVFHSRL